MQAPGRIVILNGAPRAGKSPIAAEIQARFPGLWMALGADAHIRAITPPRYRPGIGLRPGGERPDLEPVLPVLYAALYDSIAAHARLGLNVVAELGHHDGYTRPLHILEDCARRLAGLPVLFVGVRCPVEVIMDRRNAGQAGRENDYARGTSTAPIPEPVRLWQEEVHKPGIYDIELDTSVLSPAACATRIAHALEAPPSPSAFERLARRR